MRARVAKLAAGALLLLAGGSCRDLLAGVAQGERLDRGALVQSFAEEFDRKPDLWDAAHPAGRWKTNYYHSVQDTNAPEGWQSRTLAPNGEAQYYGDPKAGMDPFEWSGGVLTIVGKPNPFRADPRTHGLPYLSGLITTEKSFSQRYGYFEARMALPMGKGIWPAFWLLPQPQMVNGWAQASGQQEVDIVESIGEGDKLYFTSCADDGGRKVADEVGRNFYTSADLTQFHTYGVMVTPQKLVWFFDGQNVRERPNVDFHRPAYMLLNLAMGGNWPGMPDASTPFPARLRIDWVRAYQFKSNGS
jgi:beta-glucanase (GH16 family)